MLFMGRKDLSEVRRKEIIKSFYSVAKKNGIENTSIAKVAEHMEISNGLVMHYFNTKEELLKGLNEFILEQHLHIISSEEDIIDSREKLENFINSLFSRKWNKYFDDGLFYSCYALIYRNADFNKSFKAYLEALHNVLREKLDEARKHDIIVNENIDELAEVVFALIDGAYYYLGTFHQSGEAYHRQVSIYLKYTLALFEFSEKT
jgi:AcrR family transcriptional regulator